MTKDEFKILVKTMKAVYTDPRFIPDNDAFNVWYELLKDLEYNMASKAVAKYISLNKFPPAIADIREQYNSFTAGRELDGMAAWGMLYKAICNSGYHAREEFDKLPSAIQKTVGSPEQLRTWAMDSDFNENVVQSNFIKSYKAVSAREREYSKLPERLQAALAATETKKKLEG